VAPGRPRRQTTRPGRRGDLFQRRTYLAQGRIFTKRSEPGERKRVVERKGGLQTVHASRSPCLLHLGLHPRNHAH
jgi:hypothetical protein